MDKDILIKTSLMGFDKKTVMDFIEKVQKENEDLKRENARLTNENTSLRSELAAVSSEATRLSKIAEYTEEDDEPFITYEDLSYNDYEQQMGASAPQRLETIQRMTKKTRKPSGVKAVKPATKVRIPRK